MDVSLFDFELPEASIALRPASPRDSAKLLGVSAEGVLSDHIVRDLPDQLRAGDVLVVNETRVLLAALKAVRPARPHGGGGDVTLDINLLERETPDTWLAFARPAKRIKDGDSLSFGHDLTATVIHKGEGGLATLQFSQSGEALDAAIETVGRPPLPPYIGRKREVDEQDVSDYQTVYAEETGSVAAPTAGLHFTPELLDRLDTKGVEIERVTLHVGAGTFLPVKTDNTDDHDMHSEWYSIGADTAARINRAKSEGRRVIAVGTTSLRALESAAEKGQLKTLSKDTDIFITPGYEFQIVDGLMTNFHLPKSTLFMLVSALAGLDTMQAAYAHAIEQGYRFYSYGDSSLLWRAQGKEKS
ncbi:tRNA preQ1(34) S-adenosylmethionine ribosyltransferase-isomerase QueA [Litorimonas sp. RW-G-Af-16]|uniref:tRNA preQ1(34) S-adenosylmethionine ribosyltransferase-isomerase QueA n=1 Tax=Litorimonas sp. RW-G-Af-16 TaxID=3241168 RepID=UPI00390CCE5E